MALASIGGGDYLRLGGFHRMGPQGGRTFQSAGTLDAANEAIIFIGQVVTDDEGSHTIDTTGSSAIGFYDGTITLNDVASVLKVGIAAVDTSAGPAARAANASDVITFDVHIQYTSASKPTANQWNEGVPTSGTKTIAHGDLVAVCAQLTARGGTDSVQMFHRDEAPEQPSIPTATTFLGGSYTTTVGLPNIIIRFSDGHIGIFHGSHIRQSQASGDIGSGSTPNEYGNYFSLPFPMKIYGIGGEVKVAGAVTADFEANLYSDPLGTPVAEKTVAVDYNYASASNRAQINLLFSSPFQAAANTPYAICMKPTTTAAINMEWLILNSASDQFAYPLGTNMYAITRTTSGAFSSFNSGKNRMPFYLLVGAFDIGGNNPSYQLGI